MSASLDTLVFSPSDLRSWQGRESDVPPEVPDERLELFLQLAADIFILSTGIKEAPDANTPLGRIVKAGILDMAWYIGTSVDEREEEFSAFSGERLGSYSYTKAQGAARDSAAGLSSGVPFFDTALKFLGDQKRETDFAIHSEDVFAQPFGAYEDHRSRWRSVSVLQDPSGGLL